MLNSRVVRMFASLVAVSFFTCGQQAFSQNADPTEIQIVSVQNNNSSGNAPSGSSTTTPDLQPLAQWFGNDPHAPRNPVAGAINPHNADGSLIWPCLGEFSASQAANPDCPTIGSPSQPLPQGAIVLGVPQFRWTVAQCTLHNFTACGQVLTLYEDNTGDLTDDLVFTFTAKQGDGTVIDFGTIDFGPHAVQRFLTPFDITVAFPTNLFNPGTSQNNGHCLPNINYPVADSNHPRFPFFISNNQTCVTPTVGNVTFTVSVSLSTPTFVQTTVGCAAGQTSCFNVDLKPNFTFTTKNTIQLTN